MRAGPATAAGLIKQEGRGRVGGMPGRSWDKTYVARSPATRGIGLHAPNNRKELLRARQDMRIEEALE